MITPITPIKLDEQSDAVANLHAAIQALGFSVDAGEVREHRAGASTLKLVRAFQQQSKISLDEKQLVDQPTAAAINKLLSERGQLSSSSVGDDAKKTSADAAAELFAIQGQIRQSDGKPAVGLTVRALHRVAGVETAVGESVTDQSGFYKITYTKELFLKLSAGRDGFDAIQVVLDTPHGMHQESSAIHITRPVETINNEVNWLPWKEPDPLPPPKQFRIEGEVRWFNGRQAANLAVRAFDKDLRHEDELGQAVTDKSGRYQINYSSTQFRRAEKETADLIVRAFGGDASVSSPIIFNAGSLEIVNLILGTQESRGLSEYEQLTSEITPLLDGVTLASLEEDEKNQDVSFISGETGINREQVKFYIVASRLSDRSKLPPEFWYAALRGGAFNNTLSVASVDGLKQSTEDVISKVSTTSRETLSRALKSALDGNFINASFGSRIEKWLIDFDAFALQQLTSTNGKTQSDIKPLLKLSGLNGSKQPKFLRHYLDSGGNRNQLLKRLRGDKEFDAKEVDNIERTLILNDLTLGHTPVLEAVSRRALGEDGLRGLAKEDTDFWEKLLLEPSSAGAANTPEFIAGDSPKEKAKNYATLISDRFHKEYPTAAFTGGIERAIRNEEKTALKHREAIAGFLNTHPEFELHRTAIEPFIKEKASPEIFNAPDKESLIQELKATQRLFKLAPDYEATNTLLRDGIHSAQQIYRMSETQFVRKYADQPGFSEKSARAAYQRSANTQAALVGLVGELRAADNAKNVFALAVDSVRLTEFPNLENLFGRADVCECEQCRSVYSPAAYFADVLMFLEHRDSTTPLVSVKDVLFERRPDIGYLELSCENSNTPLPYVDVACEVLEDKVAP